MKTAKQINDQLTGQVEVVKETPDRDAVIKEAIDLIDVLADTLNDHDFRCDLVAHAREMADRLRKL